MARCGCCSAAGGAWWCVHPQPCLIRTHILHAVWAAPASAAGHNRLALASLVETLLPPRPPQRFCELVVSGCSLAAAAAPGYCVAKTNATIVTAASAPVHVVCAAKNLSGCWTDPGCTWVGTCSQSANWVLAGLPALLRACAVVSLDRADSRTLGPDHTQLCVLECRAVGSRGSGDAHPLPFLACGEKPPRHGR